VLLDTLGTSVRPSIQPWDRRYRAGFDAAVSARVHDVAASLGARAEQRRLLGQLDAFKQVVSLSALVEAVQNCPKRSAESSRSPSPNACFTFLNGWSIDWQAGSLDCPVAASLHAMNFVASSPPAPTHDQVHRHLSQPKRKEPHEEALYR
jgi:hypothetical protein